MQAKAAYTKIIEPYRAGVKLGEMLKKVAPELIILYTSIHYEENAEALLEGLYDALENEKLVIIGNSGDGILVPKVDFLDVGATALGINTNGKNKFTVTAVDDVIDAEGLEKAVECCTTSLKDIVSEDSLSMVVLAMDFRIDACKAMELIEEKLGTTIVGALSGDDRNFVRALVYANKRVIRHGIALLGVAGDFASKIYISAESKEVGKAGTITGVESGIVVTHIDDMTALEFIEKQAGRLIFLVEKGVMAFCTSGTKDNNIYYKRSIADFDYKTGKIRLLGSVALGEKVQLCYSDRDDLVEDIRLIEEKIEKEFSDKNSIAEAAVIISCAGRKWLVDDEVAEEVKMVRRVFDNTVPVIGVMSFGEFAPRASGSNISENCFHNMTFVVVLLGEKSR